MPKTTKDFIFAFQDRKTYDHLVVNDGDIQATAMNFYLEQPRLKKQTGQIKYDVYECSDAIFTKCDIKLKPGALAIYQGTLSILELQKNYDALLEAWI